MNGPVWARFVVVDSGLGRWYASSLRTARGFARYWGGTIKSARSEVAR